ncbi:thioesterase II family protein [Nocardia sp. IBHARD005]|uniref:thioesterase II family protein n=1 Tax=Nocardia sp. IBHARD005 TaxID=3457765 RepID=UPI00405A2DA6
MTDQTEAVLTRSTPTRVEPREKHTSTQLNVLCFHYAGGAPTAFRTWRDQVPDGVELTAVALPSTRPVGGRRVHRTIESVVDYVVEHYADRMTGDYVLVGHSMGALLAYLVARRQVDQGLEPPAGLVVAAFSAPQLDPLSIGVDTLDDAAFAAALARFGGLPEALLHRMEWLAPLLPTVRDDLRMCERFRFVAASTEFAVPTHVIGATEDGLVAPDRVDAWREIGTDVTLSFLEADHFFSGGAAHTFRDTAISKAIEFWGRRGTGRAPRILHRKAS